MRSTIVQGAMTEAARWHARLAADDCSEDDRRACEHWREATPESGRAFALASETLARLERAGTDPRLQALAGDAFTASANIDRSNHRWAVPLALAASIAMCAVALGLFMEDTQLAPATVYESALTARRTVVLEDGSTIELDANSRVGVRLSTGARAIELQAGRAMFDVAHDVERPFSVTAGRSRTTALGTRFQVEQAGDRVIVTLEQGSVIVQPAAKEVGSWQERLVPGDRLSMDEHIAGRSRERIDATAAASWAYGRHVFRGTPLDEAVAEVNRYAIRKIRLGDPALARLATGGNFIAGDSEQIAAALAAVLPVRVVQGGDDEIILLPDFRASGER